MAEILTAEEVIDKMVKFASVNDTINCTVYSLSQVMVEFAKMHVEAALKEASEHFDHYSNKNVILNSYPLSNIK